MEVTVTADGFGAFGDVQESIPTGFSYLSSTLEADEVVVDGDGQTVNFALVGKVGPFSFTYTLEAPSADEGCAVADDCALEGVFSGVDGAFDPFSGVVVGGSSDITVMAEPSTTMPTQTATPTPMPTPAPSGLSAIRSFSPDAVAPGDEVVVTVTASGYGSFGDVAETLPLGFMYERSNLPDDQVTDQGQTIEFALLGNPAPFTFTYTVTASQEAGAHGFSGSYSGVLPDFDSVQRGGSHRRFRRNRYWSTRCYWSTRSPEFLIPFGRCGPTIHRNDPR